MFGRTCKGIDAKPTTPQLLFQDRRRRKPVDPVTLWVMALALMALMALKAVQSDFEVWKHLAATVKHLEDTAKDAAERCANKFRLHMT